MIPVACMIGWSLQLALVKSEPATDSRPNVAYAVTVPSSANNYLLAALAAATILSKRLSPRKESQHGLNLRSPYDGPAGIVATISSCSSARSRSPVHA